MESYCIVCGEGFEFKPIAKSGNFDLSSLRPTVCSDQCYTRYREVDAEATNLRLFSRILKVLPDAYQGVHMSDFDNMHIVHAMSGKKQDVKDMAGRYLRSDYWNLTLGSTNFGNGKTRLGLYMLALAAYKGIYRTSEIHTIEDAGYFSALSIGKKLRTESFDSKQYHLKMFCKSKILMIDDLGQEGKKDYDELAGILKVREENKLKTIITTNLDEADMIEKYSGRIASRLNQGVFQVVGEDWRNGSKPRDTQSQ